MKTIVRLLLIAGIISFIRGPLQTYRTQNPQAWKEDMATLKTIPRTLGALINNEVSMIPKTPPSTEYSSGQQSSQAPVDQGTNNQVNTSPPETKTNKTQTSQPNAAVSANWLTDLLKNFSNAQGSSTANNSSSHPTNLASLSTISQWVTGLPSDGGPLKNVSISNFNQVDANQLIKHCSQLNILAVLPKLQELSDQFQALHLTGELSKADQEKVVNLFNQSMVLLELKPTFYLDSGHGQSSQKVTLATLLNQKNVKKDKITVQLNDRESAQKLATFTVEAKKDAPATKI